MDLIGRHTKGSVYRREWRKMGKSLRVVIYFRVFDTAFKTKERALEVLDGWEHKEKLSEVFVILDTIEEPEEINLLDNDFPYYRKEAHALERIEEELL